MLSLVEALRVQRGAAKAVDIRWLKPGAHVLDGVGAKLKRLRTCQLVVTDTYHCAINAWREGVPAICIGRGVETPRTTVSEKKKELLYMMFNLRPFYVFVEGLTSPAAITEEVRRLGELMDGPAVEFGRRAVSEITAIAEGRLLKALDDLLARTPN